MSNYFLMLDEAKVRQAEITRELEIIRLRKEVLRGRKPSKLAKKLQTFLASLV